jgi:hypothetical protein
MQLWLMFSSYVLQFVYSYYKWMSYVKINKYLFENTTFLFLGLGLHSPAPNARDPDVNGSRTRRNLSISVTLPSCKTNSKL